MSRRTIVIVALGLVAYLLALLRGLPAAVALPASPAVIDTSGTLWDGSAMLADGSKLEWHWAPLRSLIDLGFAADWTVSGSGSDLSGRAVLLHHATLLDETSGRASASLLALVAPNLPFVCDMSMLVTLNHAAIGGGERSLNGEVLTGAGNCARKTGGEVTSIPPLAARFAPLGHDSSIGLAPAAALRELLIDGLLGREGHLILRVTKPGAHILPFAAPPNGMTIETEF